MEAPSSSDEKGSLDEKTKKRRVKNIGELKEEAKNLKEAMGSLANEKREAKAKVLRHSQLFELCKASGVELDRAVFTQIMELLEANVHPDSILEFLRTAIGQQTADQEMVTLI